MKWFLKFMGVIHMAGDDNQKGGEGKPEPKEEGRTVSNKELHQGLKKGTKRKNHSGDDPGGEDEPPKDKVHFKGKYMTFEEYLQARRFIFLHHFSGPVDNLSTAVKEEAAKLGLRVETVSSDITTGHDLLQDQPYKAQRRAAAEGDVDGYHSGFPCTTFTKLRWRPSPGLPGPVRSQDYPYGFPDANEREEEECRNGTVMMARSAVIVDAMYKADRFMKVPGFATLENPPPSDVPGHISAWHMPEIISLVDKVPGWKCAHFNTCAYQSELPEGTRHFKPQMIGGTLHGIEELNKTCPCGRRPHEPIIGKEKSKRSAAYPLEFCVAYGKLAAKRFYKIAQAEFLEGRLVLLQDRVNHLKGATADTVQETEDIEAATKKVIESEDYQRGLQAKRKREGQDTTSGAGSLGATTSSYASSWKGGTGKHGTFKEPKAKTEVPRALVYIGGMRDPHRAVVKLPTLQSQGLKLWRAWEEFVKKHPKATEVAETYGTDGCEYNQDILEKWKHELCELWDCPGAGVSLVPRGEYKPPVHHNMLKAWMKKSGEPDVHVAEWLQHGAPLGIEKKIPTAGIFPPSDEQEGDPRDYVVADAVLERPSTLKNYKSIEDDIEEADIELKRYEDLGYLKRIDVATAGEVYKGGTISKLGLVLKTKENGEKKRRIVIDLRRSGGNGKSFLPERLVLPRLTDAVKMIREIRKRANSTGESKEEVELELALVDVSDAFTVLPVHRDELKHTLTPSTKPDEMLVFQALLFGYKVAPLLYSRFASVLARMLQAGVRLDRGGHQVYLDDSLWVLQGSLETTNKTLGFILNTMGCLGVRVALKKGARANNANWIGISLNLVDKDTLVVGLPEKFISEMQGMLEKWEGAGYAALKELRTVAGKAAWLGGVLPRARWVTSVFYAVLAQTLKEDEAPQEQKSGVRNRKGLFAVKRLEMARLWMISFLKAAKLRPMRRISLTTGNLAEIKLVTDASPEALGGLLVINGKIMAAYFSTMEEKQTQELLVEFKSSSSQAVLEALAILVGMRRWSEKLKGMAVQLVVQSDSITALALTQKLSAGSSSPGLNFLGAELAICLEELAIEEVRSHHVPGKANEEADFLSRPSTWQEVSMPDSLIGVDIQAENGPGEHFYRLPTPRAAPSLWGTKGEAAGGVAMWEAVI